MQQAASIENDRLVQEAHTLQRKLAEAETKAKEARDQERVAQEALQA